MRIYVVGEPGAGKTSLSTELGRRLGLPYLNLGDLWDRLFERDADGRITTAARTLREVVIAEHLHRDDWVIEGAEPPFLDEFAEVSDLIVCGPGNSGDGPCTKWTRAQVAAGTGRHKGKVVHLARGSLERNLTMIVGRVDPEQA